MAAQSVSALLLAASAMIVSASALTPDDILPFLTLEQKIGQMTQLNLDMIQTNGAIDTAKLQVAVGQYFVGSIINSPFAGGGCTAASPGGLTSYQFQELIGTIQAATVTAQPNLPTKVPLIYGLDSVHGANYVANGTLFPHGTGMAATFDASNYYTVGRIATLDTRAAGPPWMFSPVLGLGVQPLWSRLYETLGEDPAVGSAFGAAYIQGSLAAGPSVGLNYTASAACMKHYMGYSAPHSGKDRTDAWIPDAYVKQYFQPAFEAAARAGAPSAMINSGSVNGVPAHASQYLLTDVLRTEFGWDGVVVTDWQDIEKLQLYHAMAATPAQAIVLALNAGVDMSMVPDDYSFPTILLQLVQNGTIPESRIDESVRRILQLKIETGLFQDPVTPPVLASRVLGGDGDQAASLNITRQSITLLQNNPVVGLTNGKPILPLINWLSSGASILVVGPSSDSLSNLCGGWSISWEGAVTCQFQPGVGSTIAQAVAALAGARGMNVTAFQGVTFTVATAGNLSHVTTLARAADVVIMAIGEAPESETPGDTQDLAISPSQLALFQAINATSTPVVTVLVEPRPRILGAIADGSAGLIMAFLPCLHGGQAIAEVIFGVINPSGKLPITYPRTSGDIDQYFHKPWNATLAGVSESFLHDPLFPFGWGLSYSTLTYESVHLSPAQATPGAVVNVSVTVTNSGTMDATESVLVFVRQLYRSAITPETQLLKAFGKVFIPAGTSATLTLPLDTSDLFYWTPALARAIDAGVYVVSTGGESSRLTLTSSATVDSRTGGVQLVGEDTSGAPLSMPVASETRLARRSSPTGEVFEATQVSELVDRVINLVGDGTFRSIGPVALDVALDALRQRLLNEL